MISRVHGKGRSFKKLCSYLATGEEGLQRERERVLWVECFNLPTRNWEVAACMMAATASTSVSNTQEPLYHFTISCHPDDPVDAGTLRRIARRSIRDMGLREWQVVVFAHKDRSHLHLHFVVNRVHPERGKLWSTWRDFYRMERSLRAQEVELGLQVVPGWLAPTPAVDRLGVGLEGAGQEGTARWLRPRPRPRRGDDDFLRQVTEHATPVLQRAQSWAELERGLADHGLSARVHRGGLRFTDGRFQVKASAVGRAYSRNNLEKRFGRYPDYRARMAVASQAIAPPAREVQPAAPALQVEPPAPPRAAPAPEISTPAAGPAPASPQPPAVNGRRRPQFGDAGHGITELFGHSQPSPEREPPGISAEPVAAPEPSPEHSGSGFLKEVQERAGLVLRRAKSWAELERGLSEQGLSLRMSGGGFRVTDGTQEVKASDVGRAFSRFHLEKRLGPYPVTVPIIEPEDPAPPTEAAELPQAPVTQPQQLALPLPAPAVQEAQPLRTPPASPREDRPVAPILPAYHIVGLPPPELPPATPSLEAPTPIQPESPRAPVEPPRTVDRIQPLPPPPWTVEPDRPAEAPAKVDPAQPQRPTVRPRQRIVPRWVRTVPPSRRDGYRETVGRFKEHLAALYRDPRAARRAFEVTMAVAGPAAAVQALGLDPRQYGALTRRATSAHAEAAAQWAKVYAKWHVIGLRAERVAIAELLMAASITDEILKACQDAEGDHHAAQHDLAMLPGREKVADAAVKSLEAGYSEVYRDQPAALTRGREHVRQHGSAATAEVLRDTPELFGELRPNKEQGRVSRVLNGPDTSAARRRARTLADEYVSANERRPGPEDYAKAEERVRECRTALDAAEARRDKLPHRNSAVYVKDAQRVVLSAARKTGNTVEEVMRRVGASLPRSAVGLVHKVLHDVHRIEGPDHGQRPAGYGIDF